MMAHTPHLRSLLALGVSAAAMLAAQPVFAQTPSTTVGEVVVTAQRREQALQDVPIAVSAFSGEGLKEQRIDTGQDLLFAVPNVNFSRANFGGFNFQIRGIGTKLIATGADAAIGVHVNNVPLGASTLADSNFFDVERIEILRGPQGTQFGRNTTGGLINIITNKPTDEFSASITGELANYNSRRANGYLNIPLGDKLAFRAAGSYYSRDGFGDNLITGSDIDGRDLWSTRLTLAFNPVDTFSAYLMWEHFEEDDDRTQVGKQLCIKDPGDTMVGSQSTTLPGRQTQNAFSQGCAQGNLRGSAGLGTINTTATLGGGLGNLSGLITGDANVGKVQNPNLRNIESAINPTYQNTFDAYIFNAVWDLTDTMSLSYTASYSEGDSYQRSDYNRVTPSTTFNPFASGFLTDAAGNFDDPQVGLANQFRTFQIGDGIGESQTHEFRLQSSFDGPFNFSAGASYQKGDTTTNLYVVGNTLTAATRFLNVFAFGCPPDGGAANCLLVDPKADPDGIGANYFNSRTRYRIESRAVFGEVNYEITDTFRVTAGLRYTEDAKKAQPYAPALFVPGTTGSRPLPLQRATFGETTGRLNFDWTPDVSFTDRTLIYASFARGYKGGGFNPPQTPGQERFPTTYDPEFINAFEIGAKNTLMGGKMVLNLTGFYYDYKGYQVSQI
ncbi:MAG: TonB-dependent receptor, partial [Pseudomonadota bacterium]